MTDFTFNDCISDQKIPERLTNKRIGIEIEELQAPVFARHFYNLGNAARVDGALDEKHTDKCEHDTRLEHVGPNNSFNPADTRVECSYGADNPDWGICVQANDQRQSGRRAKNVDRTCYEALDQKERHGDQAHRVGLVPQLDVLKDAVDFKFLIEGTNDKGAEEWRYCRCNSRYHELYSVLVYFSFDFFLI